MSKPSWLAKPCPSCGAQPQFACRDEAGYFTATHYTRLMLPEQEA